MKKTLQIANILALLITIFINYGSSSGLFNDTTVADVSDKYHNLFTPAGYAFAIWGLIYLGLLGFVIYTGRTLFMKNVGKADEGVVEQIGWWFVISCIANCAWIICWINEMLGISVILMVGLLFSLLKIVINTRMEYRYDPLKLFVFIWWPFAIYSGWISVALIADVSAWLTGIGWNGFGQSAETWTFTMICIAGLINIIVIYTRNMREFGTVGVWALVAISVANQNQSHFIYQAAIVVAIIILINILIHGYMNKGKAFKI